MSSSDEDIGEDAYRSNITLPNVNLGNYRKQNEKKMNKNNLGKKIAQQTKSVRFPESYRQIHRLSTVSTSSSATNDIIQERGDESEDSDPNTEEHSNLPNFKYASEDIAHAADDDGDDYEDAGDFTGPFDQHMYYLGEESDSSEDEVKSQRSKASKNSKTSGRSRNSIRSPNNEIDLTDQPRKVSLTSSRDSEGKLEKGLKGILRKMSLAEGRGRSDEAQETSTSDTFLGRILNFSAPSGGLSGGGLAPGASRASNEKIIDEEASLGMDDEDPSTRGTEMQRIDFDALNDEAKKLISAHVPQIASLGGVLTPQISSGSEKNLSEKQGEGDQPQSPAPGASFYAPNRDLYGDDGDDNVGLLDEASDEDIRPPTKVQAGVLSSLLKLYQDQNTNKSTSSLFEKGTDGETLYDDEESYMYSDLKSDRRKGGFRNEFRKGRKMVTGKLMHKKHKETASGAASTIGDSDDEMTLDNSAEVGNSEMNKLPSFQNAKPKEFKSTSNLYNAASVPSKFSKKLKQKKRAQEQRLRITVHIADILQRQRFIIRMCRALMLFGAPTHRLEEYMVMTSRVLEIDGQFIYFPGCMIISFGDVATRTSEVHLVRCAQGLNLGKLDETHKIYKDVIHDLADVEEAARKLETLFRTKNRYPPWMCVIFYALGSSCVCPFAFQGGWYDVPMAAGIGAMVGILQFYVSSLSNLYSSVFEVSSSIVVSFMARGIGSIHNGEIFCFSALAQGALALILPGYIILCGSLELQSRNIVAGSVRMFYAIIYSLFLGFGITLGAALFGWIGHVNSDNLTCERPVDQKFYILFVPLFSLMLGLINQAAFHQIPAMIIISCTGYVGTFFAGKHFSQVTEFTACIGAFIVGILGNMYSRLFKGMAVSAMLPAIFVQVPSGIASQSSLLSGIQSANIITNSSNTSTSSDSSLVAFGISMVEVSIGISVGLFAAALVVYPFGKKRTGLFSL